MVLAALGAGARAMAARGAGAASARGALGKAATSRNAAMRAGIPAKPMGQGPLPPPPSGARPWPVTPASPANASRFRSAQQAVQAQRPQAQTTTLSQQMMDSAASRRRTSGGHGGQRYWQGSGTEVVGGMPANYDRMSIAAPRTMGMPSFGKGWQGEQLTSRMQQGIGAAVDARAESNLAKQPTQGPLQPPVYPGGLLPAPVGQPKTSAMYQQGQSLPALRQPSGIKGGPMFRGGVDTPVSQGVRFMQPSGSSERGAHSDMNGMFGSGVLWGEQTSNTIEGGSAWNANMPGSTLPGANDVANARIARGRKAGANPVKVYGATLDWPDQK